jgi:multimeric flavodoxin WrbA
MMRKPQILGLSASLRAARSRIGAHQLVEEVNRLGGRDDLDRFLAEQAKIHLDQFVAAGRAEGLAFDQLYRRLKEMDGTRGLSNSEVCLAAALWGAREMGADVDNISLSEHFPADGSVVDLDGLKVALRRADGILLSTPVYFGDRGSISQRFIEMIRADPDLCAALEAKVYAGLAVGAKRNGGQETTLIYAMLDMLGLGLLGVGNDSDTTAQYGGTAHAGDVGTMPKDEYGINTCIGTGRRIARVTAQLVSAQGAQLAERPMLDVWILQDREDALRHLIEPFCRELTNDSDVVIHGMLGDPIRPCIACDICPTHVGPDEEYRCIIRRRDDGVKRAHHDLLRPDIIVPAVLSTKNREGLVSVYQEFMERTRYLRRGDYVFTDRLVVPMVMAEVGAAEHLDIRMMTSFVRHHTVLEQPVVGWLHDDRLINPEDVRAGLARAVRHGASLTTGRLASVSLDNMATHYQPVGYVLAQAKDKERTTMEARENAIQERQRKLAERAALRLSAIGKRASGGA